MMDTLKWFPRLILVFLLLSLIVVAGVERAQGQQGGQAPALGQGLGGQTSPGPLGPTMPCPGAPLFPTPPSAGCQAAGPSPGSETVQPPQQPARAPAPPVPAEKPVPKEAEKPKTEPGPATAPPAKSPIEQAFLEVEVSPSVSRALQQFGYALFGEPASTFAPVDNVPVGPDYIIGPGDVIQVYMWGMVDSAFSLPVDRNGTIFLPKVGTLPVWGMSFNQMEELIRQQLSKYFSGFRINLTMSQLRSIKVFVVGEVARPGVYTVSSLSTVLNALFAAGGPTKLGSLRTIKLLRNNHTVGTLDLYDFLLRGDRAHDFRLESGDTVFVPPIGPVVGIAGNVKRPAIYELKEPVALSKAIEMAGGFTVLGYLQRIQVERIKDRERRVVVDLEFKDPSTFQEGAGRFLLQDGDLVQVFQVDPSRYRYVSIAGNVRRPGDYELKPGMTLKGLIAKAEGILEGTYLERGEVSRFRDDRTREIIPVDLRKLLDGDGDLPLQQWDVVTIYHQKDVIPPKFVQLSGAVQKPGRYELTPNMRLSDLLFRGGGVKPTASLENAELYRVFVDGQPQVAKVDLSKVLKGSPGDDLLLQEEDHLFIKERKELAERLFVTVSGEVRYPGTYAVARGERLSSVLKRAGGFTKDAYLKGAIFTRERVKQQQKEELDRFIKAQEEAILQESARTAAGSLQLTTGVKEEAALLQQSIQQRKELLELLKSKVVLGRVVIKLDELERFEGSPSDITLENGDTLIIPNQPNSVLVIGSVRNPTAVLYEEGKDIEYYLNRAGGLTNDADKGELHIVKADGSAVSGFLKLRKVEPGDIIVAPPSMEAKVRTVPMVKDIATILGQFALTVGVLIAAF